MAHSPRRPAPPAPPAAPAAPAEPVAPAAPAVPPAPCGQYCCFGVSCDAPASLPSAVGGVPGGGDPGGVPAGWTGAVDDDEGVDDDGVDLAPRDCVKCSRPKPERAHHCGVCRRCVLKMDHHCPWTGKCIGKRNLPYFWVFNISWCVLLIYVLMFSLPALLLLSGGPRHSPSSRRSPT